MELRLGHIEMAAAWDVGWRLAWPDNVIDQLLVEHGARYYHRDQFDHLDLTTIDWTHEQV